MTQRITAVLLLIGAVAIAPRATRAEVVDEVVAKVNDDIVSKSELDGEEQALLQQLYHDFSGAELDAKVAKAKANLLRQLIDRRILIQRAGHLFDVNKMQDFFLQQFMDQQNIKSEKDLEKLLPGEHDARRLEGRNSSSSSRPAGAARRSHRADRHLGRGCPGLLRSPRRRIHRAGRGDRP
jgi:hypothetical protein